jgi:hypothetical protein
LFGRRGSTFKEHSKKKKNQIRRRTRSDRSSSRGKRIHKYEAQFITRVDYEKEKPKKNQIR